MSVVAIERPVVEHYDPAAAAAQAAAAAVSPEVAPVFDIRRILENKVLMDFLAHSVVTNVHNAAQMSDDARRLIEKRAKGLLQVIEDML